MILRDDFAYSPNELAESGRPVVLLDRTTGYTIRRWSIDDARRFIKQLQRVIERHENGCSGHSGNGYCPVHGHYGNR